MAMTSDALQRSPPPAWTWRDAIFANLVIGWVMWTWWTEAEPLPFAARLLELIVYLTTGRVPLGHYHWEWPVTALFCLGGACLVRACLRLLRWAPRRPLIPRPRTWRQVAAASAIVPLAMVAVCLHHLCLLCCPSPVVRCETIAEAAALAGWEPVQVRLPSGSFAGRFPEVTTSWWREYVPASGLPLELWPDGPFDSGHLQPLLALIEQPRGWHPNDPRGQNPTFLGDMDPAAPPSADPFHGSARMFRGLNLDDGFSGVVVVRPVPWLCRSQYALYFRGPPTPWSIARFVPEVTVRTFALREMSWALEIGLVWMVIVGVLRQIERRRRITGFYDRVVARFMAWRRILFMRVW